MENITEEEYKHNKPEKKSKTLFFIIGLLIVIIIGIFIYNMNLKSEKNKGRRYNRRNAMTEEDWKTYRKSLYNNGNFLYTDMDKI